MASDNAAAKAIAIPPKRIEEEEGEVNKLKHSLPKANLFNYYTFYQHQGCWLHNLDNVLAAQRHFEAQDTDIFVTSCPKTGTTWLKALVFSICNHRGDNGYDFDNSTLLSHNPHELVPFLEANIYQKSICPDPDRFLSTLKPPRLFATHLPFQCLPRSIDSSLSKIVYIARNPLDTFVSAWLFYQKHGRNEKLKPEMMGQFFEFFCEGKIPYGPFEDHVLGYWRQSLEKSHKVLFVKCEDLKADPKAQLKRMAEFVGFPFSLEEEAQGGIDGIVKLCSFESLKVKEANTTQWNPKIENKWYFRKGEAGDWVNYLTPEMAERLQKLMDEKFKPYGLILN